MDQFDVDRTLRPARRQHPGDLVVKPVRWASAGRTRGSSKRSRSNAAVLRNRGAEIVDLRGAATRQQGDHEPVDGKTQGNSWPVPCPRRCRPPGSMSSRQRMADEDRPTAAFVVQRGLEGKQCELPRRPPWRCVWTRPLPPEVHGRADVVGRRYATLPNPALEHQVEDVEVDAHHDIHPLVHEMTA